MFSGKAVFRRGYHWWMQGPRVPRAPPLPGSNCLGKIGINKGWCPSPWRLVPPPPTPVEKSWIPYLMCCFLWKISNFSLYLQKKAMCTWQPFSGSHWLPGIWCIPPKNGNICPKHICQIHDTGMHDLDSDAHFEAHLLKVKLRWGGGGRGFIPSFTQRGSNFFYSASLSNQSSNKGRITTKRTRVGKNNW